MRNFSQGFRRASQEYYDWKDQLPFLDPNEGVLAMIRPEAQGPGIVTIMAGIKRNVNSLHAVHELPMYAYFQGVQTRLNLALGYAHGPVPVSFPSYYGAGGLQEWQNQFPGGPYDPANVPYLHVAFSSLLVSRPFTVPTGKRAWFGLAAQQSAGRIVSMFVVKKSQWDAIAVNHRSRGAVLSRLGSLIDANNIYPANKWHPDLARFGDTEAAPASLMGLTVAKAHPTNPSGEMTRAVMNGNSSVANYTWANHTPALDLFGTGAFGVGAVLDFDAHTIETGFKPFGYGGTYPVAGGHTNEIFNTGSNFAWGVGDEFVVVMEMNHAGQYDSNQLSQVVSLHTPLRRIGFIGWEDPDMCDTTYATAMLPGKKHYIGVPGANSASLRTPVFPYQNVSLGAPGYINEPNTKPANRNFTKTELYYLPKPSVKSYFECKGFIRQQQFGGDPNEFNPGERVGVLWDPSVGTNGTLTLTQGGIVLTRSSSLVGATALAHERIWASLIFQQPTFEWGDVYLDPAEWEVTPAGVAPWFEYPPKKQLVVLEDNFKGAFVAPRTLRRNALGVNWVSAYAQDLTAFPLEVGGGLKFWTGSGLVGPVPEPFASGSGISIDLGTHINSFTMELVASIQNPGLQGTFYMDLYIGNDGGAGLWNGDFIEFAAGGSNPANKMTTYGFDPVLNTPVQPTTYGTYIADDTSYHTYKFEYTKDGFKRLYYDGVLLFEAEWVGFSWQGAGTEGTFVQIDIFPGTSGWGLTEGEKLVILKSIKISA